MKFKLLEIESAANFYSRSPESGAKYPRTSAINYLTLLLEHLSPAELKDLINITVRYDGLFTLLHYGEDEATMRVNLQQLRADFLVLLPQMEPLKNYIAQLDQAFTSDHLQWQKNYGLGFDEPQIMAVLNVTPDSFSDGGRYPDVKSAVDATLRFVEQGANIIDIGGESSRPGARPVETQEEISRVVPVITQLRRETDVLISIDTYKAGVAAAALQAGADWINDISGFRMDSGMMPLARKMNVPVVVMHMQGTPAGMQENPHYEEVVEDLAVFFEERISTLKGQGIGRIIIDPGIGFGKTLQHNLQILRNLPVFKQFGYPLLIGTSRKSFIGAVTGRKVTERISGTLASVVWSVLHGADIVRVHDIAECADALKIINSIYDNVNQN